MPTEPLDGLLRDVVARSSFPFERRHDGWLRPPLEQVDDGDLDRRLRDWTNSLSPRSSPEHLRRLVDYEGLTLAEARALLGPVRLADGAALPAWAQTLGRALAGYEAALDDERELFDPAAPVPFEEALLPFVLLLRERLEPAGLDDTARRGWERRLLGTLGTWAVATLFAEFSSFRGPTSTFSSVLDRAAGLPPPHEAYRRFIGELAAGGMARVVARYPVLGRVLGQITHRWIAVADDLLERLACDRPLLEAVFNDGRALGAVVAVVPALSDAHRGGQQVALVRFADGPAIVYKPRNLGMETAYGAFLEWLVEAGAPLAIKAPAVLERGPYGWVEYIEPRPCPDAAALTRYYERAGQLLCLAHVLCATDCHYENLIADGEQPMLIDAETLMHHRLVAEAGAAPGAAQERAADFVARSVLRTGLLPIWQAGADARFAHDVSGFGAEAGAPTSVVVPHWIDVNSDRMARTQKRSALGRRHNAPRLGDAVVPIDDHMESFLRGFRSLYEFMQKRRERLLAADGPIAIFEGQTTRIVFRSTQVYGLILMAIQDNPSRMRDGADAGTTLDLLSRTYVTEPQRPVHWPLLAAEREALARLDVPVFEAPVDGRQLLLENGEGVPGCIVNASLADVRDRVAGLCIEDLEAQVELATVALRSLGRPPEPSRRSALAGGDARPVDPEPATLVDAAGRLADVLAARAIHGRDGSLTWVGPRYLPNSTRIEQASLRVGLWDGVAGVALFFAARSRVGDDRRSHELAVGAWQTVRTAIRRDGTVGSLGLGAGTGLGSLLYAAAEIGRLLEIDVDEDVDLLLDGFDDEAIANDGTLDVMGGAAGAILGLLAADPIVPNGRARDLASRCGYRLIGASVATADGSRAWPCEYAEGAQLTGFAHGAAGIAYALVRLSQATGDCAFKAAAEDGIGYERAVFDPNASNWPDLQLSGQDSNREGGRRFQTAWCHGAPGIGLARLGGLAVLDTPAIRADISIALETTQAMLQELAAEPDHLCCGNTGRIELLASAGQRLDRPELTARARRLAAEMLNAAGGPDHLWYAAGLPRGVYFPGLFTGAAGVGYELLRLAYPESLPSVLLWESPDVAARG